MAADKAIAAAVDIGTNSVKMTVAHQDDAGRAEILHDETRITRLGKKVDASGRLDSEAVQQTIDALRDFGVTAQKLGAHKIAAVGTSALRDAANRDEFVSAAEAALSGRVEVISGEREAALTFLAARRDPDLGLASLPHNVTVATTDSGGGSTEVVLGAAGNGGGIAFKASLQLGAVRLTERAAFSDPPRAEELANAEQIARDAFAEIPKPDGPVVLVASGGTAANLAAMEIMADTNRAQKLTPDLLHGTNLSLEQIERRIAHLASLPLSERRNVPGLEPDRADVIIAGAIIQAESLRHFGLNTLLVSARGLRYGLLYELLGLD